MRKKHKNTLFKYQNMLYFIYFYFYKIYLYIKINTFKNVISDKISILIICPHTPSVFHAGGLRILDIIKQIKTENPNSYIEIFTHYDDKSYGNIDVLKSIVDNIVMADINCLSLIEYVKKGKKIQFFHIIDFQFPQPLPIIEDYKKICYKTIFTPMESQIRAECINSKVSNKLENELTSEDAKLEANICKIVDTVVCVGTKDAECINACVNSNNIMVLETAISDIEFSNIFKDVEIHSAPNTVVYVAYFESQTNKNALIWYLKYVHPFIIQEIPSYQFKIVGKGDISYILNKDYTNILYVGEVVSIEKEIKNSKVGIAPALSGSGIRGKINQYAALAIPCVCSGIAADGLLYTDGISILVSDQPEDFAKNIIYLLKNETERCSMAEAANSICKKYYTWDSKRDIISTIYNL